MSTPDPPDRSPHSGAEAFRDKRVTVAGLGRFGGGVGVTRWLARLGARVTVSDIASAEDLADSVRALEGQPKLRDICPRSGDQGVLEHARLPGVV